MDLLLIAATAAAVICAAAAAFFSARLKAARAALVAAEARQSPPPPPRVVESRREHFGLLWFPTLAVKDSEKLIVAAAAGLPHCARCIRAMNISAGPPEEWVCGGCSERRPPSTADIQVTDSVIAETLKEFLLRFPDYRPASGFSAPRRGPAGS